GGLAGAAAPEQGDELVPPDLEVDTGEDLAVAEAAAEPAGHGDVLAGGRPALGRRGRVGGGRAPGRRPDGGHDASSPRRQASSRRSRKRTRASVSRPSSP